MVRVVFLAAAFAAISVFGAPVSPASAQEADRQTLEGIAAIVNDKPISYSDVRQRARLLLLTIGASQPTQEQVQQITGQALEQLIDEKLQLDRVSEFEVEVDPVEIDAAVQNMASEAGVTGEVLREQLTSSGVNPASLEEQMRAEIAWNRLMSGLYGNRIRISENQVDDQMSRLRTASQKTQYRIGEIFLYAPDEATKTEALTAAESIISQLQQGADFRVAAQRISSAPTAAAGGDMGWVTIEDIDPTIAEAVRNSSGNGLLEPIQTENGIYIILLGGKREPAEPVTRVDLKRLVAADGVEATLTEAIGRINSCDDVQSVANTNSGLRAQDIADINVDELGPEGRSLVLATDVGQPTEIFAVSSGLAVMYVCRRQDGAEALPSREDLKGSLKSRELNMISERELRNARRLATIIYR
ncbi:PPIC-type PPIASE domain protein [Hyphomonas neptunium ATCC 15444]|uniref:Parvulin-like PPIase n=2 Tax=Hyphomonas TaxID=85 RepID=Q0C096_HYPNA|nr:MULTISPECIES: peptidylprolyl isomerase [Hyphomonas]ABI76157.1 PPIC-type PPIASE domain protein [Hyphomonas neptunium ATCC 15444]KCZ90572.1 peptidyl-prolyl cis-trans isomerase domain-containing protein [Hyphomonas hirschiana VP5]